MRMVAVAWFLILAGVALTAAGGPVAWLGLVMWLTGLLLQIRSIFVSRMLRVHFR